MSFPQEKYYTEEDYYNQPESSKAELIDGRFYFHAAPSRIHQKILAELHITIGQYIKSRHGSCEIYPAPFAVKLSENKNTIVEPDISVICDKNKLTDQGCLGAPDWIIEIVSPSTSSHDYVRKLNLYLNAGVREYWIINPMEKNVLVYDLEENRFKMNAYTFQDNIKAAIFEDLWIDFPSMDLA